jgi:YtxH-like protein
LLPYSKNKHHEGAISTMTDYKKYGEYSRQSSSAGRSCGIAMGSFAVGAGIGALISLLLAPRSGREIRRGVADKFGVIRRGVTEQTSRLRQRGSEIVGQGRERVVPMSG